MHKQSPNIVKWERQSKKVLFVLFLFTVLTVLSIYFTSSIAHKNISNVFYYAAMIFVAIFGFISFFLINKIVQAKKIADELLLENELFRTTLGSIGEGLITTGKKGEIIYMNPAAESITGWKTEEATNLPIQKVYNVRNEETDKPFDSIVSRILKDGCKVELENNTILKTKNSSNLIISNSGAPLFDSKGNISGTVLVFNDITDKKIIENKLKEREQQYRDLIQNLPEAVYTCDEFGFIQMYNKAAVALWGRKPVPGNEQWGGSWRSMTIDGKEMPLSACPMAITLKEKRPVHGEQVIIQRPDGSLRHVLPYPTPLFDTNGKLTGAVNMLIDITDKKEKEILIRQTEEKYRHLIDQASDAIIVYSFDGTIYDFNQAVYKVTGYTKEEFSRLKLQDILIDKVVINPGNVERMKAGETVLFIRKVKRKDGTIFDVEINSRILPDGRTLAFVRDITERKKAELQLAESEKNLRHVLSSGSDSFYVIDRKCYVTLINEKASSNLEKAWGKPVVIGTNILELLPNENEEPVRSSLVKVFAGHEVEYELPISIKNLPAWVLVNYKPVRDELGTVVGAYIITKDITERKSAEEEVKKLSLVAKKTINAVIITDAEERIQWINEAFTRMTGYELNEVIGKRPGTFLQGPESNPVIIRYMRRKIKNKQAFEIDIVNYTKSGKKIWTRIQCQPQFDATGKLTSFFSIQTDITTMKEAEEALLTSEERYRHLFNNNPQSIVLWDIDTLKILEVNDTAALQYGYKREEFLQLTVLDLRPPEDYNKIDELVKKMKQNPTKRMGIWRHINKAGDELFMSIVTDSIIYKGKAVMLSIADNVTEKIKVEKELEKERILKAQQINDAVLSAQENERQEIGRELHDNINQILASSRLYLGMAKQEKEKGYMFLDKTDMLINNAINEIRTLSHSLIPPALNESDLMEIVDDIIENTKRTTTINVQKQLSGFEDKEIGDKFKLTLYRIIQEQFNNILKYASAKNIFLHLVWEGATINLIIKDDGIGFDTNKKICGVGLMNIKTRSSLFNGEMQILSSPGNGCQLKVTFPAPPTMTINE